MRSDAVFKCVCTFHRRQSHGAGDARESVGSVESVHTSEDMRLVICVAVLVAVAAAHRAPPHRVHQQAPQHEPPQPPPLLTPQSTCSAPVTRLRDGNFMPRFGFGTWLGFDENQVPIPVTDESVQLAVEMAIDAGYRHIDTASIYHIEDQVGRAVNKKIQEGVVRREELFITTKLWNDAHRREAVVPALRESLQRLNLTYVDLYLIHYPIATETKAFKPYADVDYLQPWPGMVEAHQLKLTKSIGICNYNKTQLQRLWDSHEVKPAVLQIETNLNLQQAELREYCHDNDIAVIGYTPFGSLFPNKLRPGAPPPRVDHPMLVAMAQKYNKTVPQIVLRFNYELGVTPIPKTVTKSRIYENLNIFDFTLDDFDRRDLKNFDTGFRVVDVKFFSDSPYYPF
ncbi:aldo-keto reductase AKR2E4 [Bicyclus anynana]|uniref:Aldo-keto reductase AKR2E4 n=1 Tax=Bicyclus anynana TaxID=110368 RepID=A0A6J1MQS6_BICAN|nr:aldo-keto reductase AKR2E4 [Bicyclus anynana]